MCTPEFGRRRIMKQNSVPPMGHGLHQVHNGMSPMCTVLPLSFTNHITKAEVYNRPGESESFARRNDGDLYTY